MQRQIATYPLQDLQYKELKKKMLNWVKPLSIFLFLDSNDYEDKYGRYECLLACGVEKSAYSLSSIQQIHDNYKDWLFGHICYDHKNELDSKLSSRHTARLHWQDLYFFQPEVVCYIGKGKNTFTIESLHTPPLEILENILNTPLNDAVLPKLSFTRKIDRETYIPIINAIREHIRNGDCYEINICNEAYAVDVTIDPHALFDQLQKISPAPFASFYRNEERYMICSSPERYLCRKGDTILSQPIKGTAPRGGDAGTDDKNKLELKTSVKDRAENVMIVDLVRNDLARSCEVSSVTVDELFGIYSFPQVHQMISTVSGRLKAGAPFTDAIRYSFPMGSMTGAPKIKVMQLIDQYEHSRRELFSGTVGYIDPAGDFDFNVIIRSLFYNSTGQYLSYQTGGAITYDSTPEGEWDELQLKAWALERIFNTADQ